MKLTATELRQNLYKILDRVAETGERVEIPRKSGTVRISTDRPGSIWDRLEVYDVIAGDLNVSFGDVWDGEPELDAP